MNNKFKRFSCLLLLCILISCNKRFFVDRHLIIEKQKGVMVFIDNESRRFRNIGNGCIFTTDSLTTDFFIPYNFANKIVTRRDIVNAIFSKSQQKMKFFYFIRDCNGEERSSSIDIDCTALLLDNNVDDYLHSNKIYVQLA